MSRGIPIVSNQDLCRRETQQLLVCSIFLNKRLVCIRFDVLKLQKVIIEDVCTFLRLLGNSFAFCGR